MGSSNTNSGSVEDTDSCTGFPTTHKAKLSITSIVGGSHLGSGSIVPNGNKESSQSRTKRWMGLILTVLSALTFSLTALLAKLLSHLHPFNLGLWTYLTMAIIAGLLIMCRAISRNSETRWQFCSNEEDRSAWKISLFLMMRSFFGVSALVCFCFAVRYITVADAIVIDASSPIFVHIMACIFLGEKLGFLPFFCALAAFSGVALISRPQLLVHERDYDLNSLIGVIFSLSATLFITASIITLKLLENVSNALVNLCVGLWGSVQCVLLAWICGILSLPTETTDILKLVSIAVLFYLGQALLTQALRYQDAGPVGLLRTTEVVFVFVWQFLFLGVVPDIFSWCGTVLILLGALLTLLRDWIITLPDTSRWKNNCGFLLY